MSPSAIDDMVTDYKVLGLSMQPDVESIHPIQSIDLIGCIFEEPSHHELYMKYRRGTRVPDKWGICSDTAKYRIDQMTSTSCTDMNQEQKWKTLSAITACDEVFQRQQLLQKLEEWQMDKYFPNNQTSDAPRRTFVIVTLFDFNLNLLG